LTLCENNAARLSLALTFQFTYTGTPLIYYGDEIGMRGGNDPHCRGTMIWEQTAWNTKILETYRQLIHIRRQHPALRRGKFKVLKIFNAVYAYLRYTEDDEVLVILNPRAARENFHVPLGGLPPTGHHWHDLLSGEDYTVAQGELLIPHLGAETAMVLVPAVA
jgi:alpha-glucosidase